MKTDLLVNALLVLVVIGVVECQKQAVDFTYAELEVDHPTGHKP